ncbi:MAG: SMP-30/gluconolactonase/LRE family protein [Pseudomonadota bacterium]
MELVDVVAVGNTLGEGVVWDAAEACVWWTDIQSARLCRYDPANRELADYATPERLCAFALRDGERGFLAAFESGFGFWTPGSNDVTWLHRLARHPAVRLNDGKTDRQGRFWCGGLQETKPDREPGGQLWSVHADGTCRTHRDGIRISNSLCTSPDGKVLYFTDTPTRQIERYDLDTVSGALKAPALFVQTEPHCYPDGSTVDADGYLWNAQWGASQVVRYAPNGSVDRVLPVPASQPTCVAFGGVDATYLFVTTARETLSKDALSDEQHAGDLLIYRTPYRGIADTRFGQR